MTFNNTRKVHCATDLADAAILARFLVAWILEQLDFASDAAVSFGAAAEESARPIETDASIPARRSSAFVLRVQFAPFALHTRRTDAYEALVVGALGASWRC